jgi:hypothetical protein
MRIKFLFLPWTLVFFISQNISFAESTINLKLSSWEKEAVYPISLSHDNCFKAEIPQSEIERLGFRDIHQINQVTCTISALNRRINFEKNTDKKCLDVKYDYQDLFLGELDYGELNAHELKIIIENEKDKSLSRVFNEIALSYNLNVLYELIGAYPSLLNENIYFEIVVTFSKIKLETGSPSDPLPFLKKIKSLLTTSEQSQLQLVVESIFSSEQFDYKSIKNKINEIPYLKKYITRLGPIEPYEASKVLEFYRK